MEVSQTVSLAVVTTNCEKSAEPIVVKKSLYADDLIIMIGSKQAADRVMKSVSRFIEEKLGLKVNAEKSKVDKPKGIKYLGFGFYFDSFAKAYKAKPHQKVVAKFKAQMKKLTCRSWGVSNDYKVLKLNQLRTVFVV